jgi:hypothetical protein
MRKTFEILFGALVALVAFTATAFAASSAGAVDESLVELAKPLYAAVMSGQWMLAAAAALVFFVAAARKYAAPRWPFLASDAGGVLLVLLGSFGGAAGTALAAGAVPSLAMAWVALGVAVSAAGGYSILKKLAGPLVPKAPMWLQPLFRLVLWFFDHSTEPAVAEATKAGNDAVAAKPPTGVAGIVGKPTDVP